MFKCMMICLSLITAFAYGDADSRTLFETTLAHFIQEQSYSSEQYEILFKQAFAWASDQEIEQLVQSMMEKDGTYQFADFWFYALKYNRADIVDKSYVKLSPRERQRTFKQMLRESSRAEYYDHLKQDREARFQLVEKILQLDPDVVIKPIDKYNAIDIDAAFESIKLSKLLLPLVTCRHQKNRAINYAINERNAELVSLFFDLTNFEKLMQDDACKYLANADDLTAEQKEILSDAYKKIDLKKLCVIAARDKSLDHTVLHQEALLEGHGVHNLSDDLLYKYMPVIMYQKLILQPEAQENNSSYTAQLMMRLFKKYPNNYYQFLSPTLIQHAGRSEHKIIGRDYLDCAMMPDLMRSGIMSKIIEMEKQYKNSDYHLLFHARSWYWNFVKDMWNMIDAIEHDKSLSFDHTALRYRNEKSYDIESLKKCREQLLGNGPEKYQTTTVDAVDCASEVTCLNHSIISNNDMSGIWSARGSEMTASYFVDGGHDHIYGQEKKLEFIQNLLKQSGMSDCVTFDELQELYQLHAKISGFGAKPSELLAVLVAKVHADEVLYPARDGCGLAWIVGKPSQLLDGTYEKLQNEKNFTGTTDHFYGLAVSDIPGEQASLEQNGKYMIKSLHAAKPEEYQKYCVQRDQLFEKMKQRYAQKK